MEQKLYQIKTGGNDNYYVIAFSKEHAIVELVTMLRCLGQEDNPTEYSVGDVTEITKDYAEDVIIDYNYITESYEKESLSEFFESVLEKEEDIYGVVCDDFIIYPESFSSVLNELRRQ